MTAALLRTPHRMEVREPDLTGHLVALAEQDDDGRWRTYPDLTGCPRVRATVAGATVLTVVDQAAAIVVLTEAWPAVAL